MKFRKNFLLEKFWENLLNFKNFVFEKEMHVMVFVNMEGFFKSCFTIKVEHEFLNRSLSKFCVGIKIL